MMNLRLLRNWSDWITVDDHQATITDYFLSVQECGCTERSTDFMNMFWRLFLQWRVACELCRLAVCKCHKCIYFTHFQFIPNVLSVIYPHPLLLLVEMRALAVNFWLCNCYFFGSRYIEVLWRNSLLFSWISQHLKSSWVGALWVDASSLPDTQDWLWGCDAYTVYERWAVHFVLDVSILAVVSDHLVVQVDQLLQFLCVF